MSKRDIPLINSSLIKPILLNLIIDSKVGVEAIAEKLPNPVNHCSLSSRKSQVQIQPGAHFSIENNFNKIMPKD